MSRKVIKEKWYEVLLSMSDLNIPLFETKVMEKCFFAGALISFNAITDIIAKNKTPNGSAIEEIKELYNELYDYSHQKKEKGENNHAPS